MSAVRCSVPLSVLASSHRSALCSALLSSLLASVRCAPPDLEMLPVSVLSRDGAAQQNSVTMHELCAHRTAALSHLACCCGGSVPHLLLGCGLIAVGRNSVVMTATGAGMQGESGATTRGRGAGANDESRGGDARVAPALTESDGPVYSGATLVLSIKHSTEVSPKLLTMLHHSERCRGGRKTSASAGTEEIASRALLYDPRARRCVALCCPQCALSLLCSTPRQSECRWS